MESPVQIYFAGKIGKNDWRHSIVPNLRNAWGGWCCNEADPRRIEPIRFSVASAVFDYVGPYFVGCDHGCFHGPQSHGTLDSDLRSDPYSKHRRMAFELCLSWLRRSAVVFAHVDSGDAQGTFFELGWVHGRLPVFLNFATESLAAECWFPGLGACCVSINPDARAAFLNFLPRLMLCRNRN